MIKVDIFDDGNIIAYDNTIADSVMFEKIRFNFPDTWNGYDKTAVFGNGETKISVLLNEDNTLCTGENECYVPYEVIKAPFFTVSVFGVSGDSRATTPQVRITVRESGYGEGDVPTEPTPTQYEQLVSLANATKEIAQSVRDDANNGVFKGEKGDTGSQGEKGDKGEKGDIGPQGVKGDSGDVSIEYLHTNFASSIKNTVSGNVISVRDVSPAEHNLKIQLTSDTLSDFSGVTVSVLGKNLFDKSVPYSKYFTISGGYSALEIYIGKGNTATVSLLEKYNTGLGGFFYCKANKYNYSGSSQQWLYHSTVADWCNKSKSITSEDGYISLFLNPNAYSSFIDEIMVEIGTSATEYQSYIQPQIISSNSDGTVSGLTSLSPNMTIITDTDGVTVDCTYNADTKLYIDNKIAELVK